MQQAAELNAAWHSKLPEINLPTVKGKTAAHAATYDGAIYAVALWSDPVAPSQDAHGDTIELRRFAISPDAPRYTASRMLRVMSILIARKHQDARRLISYQASACHSGTIYAAAGWVRANVSKYAEWGTRKRRIRAAGFITAPSKRKPSQIVSDKVRWEKKINGGGHGVSITPRTRRCGVEDSIPPLFGVEGAA